MQAAEVIVMFVHNMKLIYWAIMLIIAEQIAAD